LFTIPIRFYPKEVEYCPLIFEGGSDLWIWHVALKNFENKEKVIQPICIVC